MSGLSIPIPTIESKNLILRAPRETDFDALARFSASTRSVFVGGPYERPRAWGSFLAQMGHWSLRGYGMWMIEDRATGAPAGRVGVINNDGWDEPELGWHLFEGFEGQGVAYEAALAARAYAAEHQGLDALISYVDPANHRSAALARRLGAKIERDGTVNGHACKVWRHPSVMGEAA